MRADQQTFPFDWTCLECGCVHTIHAMGNMGAGALLYWIAKAHEEAEPRCPSRNFRYSSVGFYGPQKPGKTHASS